MPVGDRVQSMPEAGCILLQAPAGAWLMTTADARELAKALLAEADALDAEYVARGNAKAT